MAMISPARYNFYNNVALHTQSFRLKIVVQKFSRPSFSRNSLKHQRTFIFIVAAAPFCHAADGRPVCDS